MKKTIIIGLCIFRYEQKINGQSRNNEWYLSFSLFKRGPGMRHSSNGKYYTFEESKELAAKFFRNELKSKKKL